MRDIVRPASGRRRAAARAFHRAAGRALRPAGILIAAAVFRRRKRLGLAERVQGILWPRIGWRRAAAYFLHRVRRLPGSPHTIAAGFACGAAISFTPFIGLHFVLAALLAWIIGGNVIASAFGTVVGNPWTFPIIWIGIYRLGSLLLGWEVGHGLPESISITYIFDHPIAVLLPMSLGGIVTAAVAWLAFYWLVLGLVAEYQELRHRRRSARRGGGTERAKKASRLVPPAKKEGKI